MLDIIQNNIDVTSVVLLITVFATMYATKHFKLNNEKSKVLTTVLSIVSMMTTNKKTQNTIKLVTMTQSIINESKSIDADKRNDFIANSVNMLVKQLGVSATPQQIDKITKLLITLENNDAINQKSITDIAKELSIKFDDKKAKKELEKEGTA